MPTYAYKCRQCGHRCEIFQKITDEPSTECPACQASALQRLISGGSFHLQGSGWYSDGYNSSSTSSPSSTTSSDTPTSSSSCCPCGKNTGGCQSPSSSS